MIKNSDIKNLYQNQLHIKTSERLLEFHNPIPNNSSQNALKSI